MHRAKKWGVWTALAAGVWLVVEGLSGAAANPAEAAGRKRFPEIGVHTAIEQRGRQTPRGWGVVVGHVEGDPDAYGPARTKPEFRKIDFTMRSGAPQASTGHATTAANKLYGYNGVAIGVSDVHVFSSEHWLREGYLGVGTLKPPLMDDPIKVFSHSWIASLNQTWAERALARLDYVADARHVHIVAGVGNGRGDVPHLLGSAYNVIAVGSMSGSSGNYTRIDTPGRCKPDVVGPRGATSWTTPQVAGVVAGLLEQAQRMNTTHPTAARTDTIRSVLMAGAIKPEGWAPETGKPLDPFLGAGIVHYNRALTILENPLKQAGQPVSAPGWGFFAVRRGAQVVQRFELKNNGEFCLSLNWNRRVFGLWQNLRVPKGAVTSPPALQPQPPGPQEAPPGHPEDPRSPQEAPSEAPQEAPSEAPSQAPVGISESPPKSSPPAPPASLPAERLEKADAQAAIGQAAPTRTTTPQSPAAGTHDAASGRPAALETEVVRGWIARPAVCQLHLVLERQTADGWQPVAESASDVDNVQHAYFRNLAAGTYRARVVFPDAPMNTPRGDGLPEVRPINGWTFALSWWMGPALTPEGRILHDAR